MANRTSTKTKQASKQTNQAPATTTMLLQVPDDVQPLPTDAATKRVQDAYAGARNATRIGLSDFSHGRKWREDLAQAELIEIVDRTETAGWLISDNSLALLMERIENLEEELEQMHIEAIFAARASRNNWLEGEDLAKAAKKSAKQRRNAIEKAVRGC